MLRHVSQFGPAYVRHSGPAYTLAAPAHLPRDVLERRRLCFELDGPEWDELKLVQKSRLHQLIFQLDAWLAVSIVEFGFSSKTTSDNASPIPVSTPVPSPDGAGT